MSTEAMKLALEALMRSRKAVSGDLDLAGCAYGSNDPDGHRYDDAKKALVTLDKAITALREALANEALDKMAENARELGLDYEVEPKIGCVNHDCDKCKAQQEQEQEPVAYLVDGDLYYPEEIDWETLQEQGHTVTPLYTSPPAQRTWVGLTKSEITTSLPYSVTRDKGCFHAGALWADDKLKEKNV